MKPRFKPKQRVLVTPEPVPVYRCPECEHVYGTNWEGEPYPATVVRLMGPEDEVECPACGEARPPYEGEYAVVADRPKYWDGGRLTTAVEPWMAPIIESFAGSRRALGRLKQFFLPPLVLFTCLFLSACGVAVPSPAPVPSLAAPTEVPVAATTTPPCYVVDPLSLTGHRYADCATTPYPQLFNDRGRYQITVTTAYASRVYEAHGRIFIDGNSLAWRNAEGRALRMTAGGDAVVTIEELPTD